MRVRRSALAIAVVVLAVGATACETAARRASEDIFEHFTDKLVHPATTNRYVARLCADHELVDYRHSANTGHGLITLRALPAVRQWFGDALSGRVARTTCVDSAR